MGRVANHPAPLLAIPTAQDPDAPDREEDHAGRQETRRERPVCL